MLFNSLDFAFFLPVVFCLYWFVFHKKLWMQNLFIVVSSYVFYGWWDARFLVLIIFSTSVDFIIGILLKHQPARKNFWLGLSIAINLGVLGFFKYFNFFLENFTTAFSFFGHALNITALEIVLPVGISFYTFQTLSYTIDVYRGKLEPTRDPIVFAAFVSFFPQLVAGPIERATRFLPQLIHKRVFNFDQAQQGVRFILWGLFRKVVIADALAPSVNLIFEDYAEFHWTILVLGVFFFSLQIYCDFSGYSLIARGVSKLMGIELMTNFNYPYFSRNIGEFWRRWHISLSTWFRDYLYIPLGGSRVSKTKAIRNVFIIFLVSGFWHGANWTFIAWGGFHAALFLPAFLLGTHRAHLDNWNTNRWGFLAWKDALKILSTFILVSLGWIFFRAENLAHAIDYLSQMIDFSSNRTTELINPYDNQPLSKEYTAMALFFLVEYLAASKIFDISEAHNHRFSFLIDVILLIFIVINIPLNSNLSFIYFQF